MVQHITNTQTPDLKGVFFEDVNALVSSKNEAWLVTGFLYLYYSTKQAAERVGGKM